ncbi:hypothetical protein [Jiangella sp. DSM 45060]|uniref:hypothetical protein n=1 Tax=Jiangella sp. DSM 45060 TaxID=1798224 RepID=UPI00087CD2D1|nr:hypothetical protein [Jiangella sp. DSM 45060]SDT68512.1 hypothetical protein SAMN04515669_5881 [Jiangella sp. DSM 45060]
MRHRGWLAGVVVGLTACTAADAEPGDVATEPEQQRFTGTFLVLEDAEHGPQVCYGGALFSNPPKCGGPDIPNWDWSAVEHESVDGVRWGDYQVTGTFDGTEFTLTEPAGPPEPPGMDDGRPDLDALLDTPCEAPPEGWVLVDIATASTEVLDAVVDYAAALPGYGGLWVDRSVEQPPGVPPSAAAAAAILNVSFTGDLAAREAELRAVWGGALCVTQARHEHSRLEEIQAELAGEFGIYSASVSGPENLVEVDAFIDDGLQEQLDETYGPGTVRVTSALRPVPPDDAPTIYAGTFTVIESRDGDVNACSMVMESYPPGCGGGFELRGWSWEDVRGEESSDGVTWGDYHIKGTWDGTALTLTAPPEPPPPSGPREDLSQRFDTPCPTPPGGWAILDGALTHATDFQRAHAYALAAPGYVDSWLDRHVAPEARSATAPAEVIVNFRFTGDLATHEAALRSLYGGAICVSQAERSQQEMEATGAEIAAAHDALAWTVESPANTVWIQVIVDDGLQERLDEEYGPGLVRVEALLKPVD